MNIIAKFEKISFENFKNSIKDLDSIYSSYSDEEIKRIYNELPLPRNATQGSAGHDFHTPIPIHLEPGETIKIPTGIRCKINPGWVLLLFPRSGLGFKYRLQLDNTIGVVDQDYYGSDNEGHIFIKMTNDSKKWKTIDLLEKDAFAQGIFLPYGIAENASSNNIRNGGGSSTDNLVKGEIK